MGDAMTEVKIGGRVHQVHLSALRVDMIGDGDKHRVSLRCPYCGNRGTLEPLRPISWMQSYQSWGLNLTACLRVCPNESCQRPIFTISEKSLVLFCFPPETLDFEASGLPDRVKGALEEAIACHAAGCYRAAAIMVRRTLEEICADKQAAGRDLKSRIQSLSTLITLPTALLEAMDELRLLGNDAAHIEAKTYENIGKAEVEAGVALAKEFVKATYQYEDLVAKLRSLSNRT